MTKRRAHGDGNIEERGENIFRLRYRVNKKRYRATFRGTLKEARTELRRLLRSGDTGEHVAPDKATLATWAKHWIEIGAPGRKKQKVGERAIERYNQLLRTHVLPTLGEYKLQQIDSAHIDKLYPSLEGKIAPRTARHVHSVLNARTITIDDDLLALLLAEREKHLRMIAGVPDGLTVNLGLVKLPEGAFPNSSALADLSFVTPLRPRFVTKEFARKARKLGFKTLRLHDLRGTHETMLLDAGVPVHVVAARCGHDPATLLRSYAKRTRKADTSAASVIGNISRTILGK